MSWHADSTLEHYSSIAVYHYTRPHEVGSCLHVAHDDSITSYIHHIVIIYTIRLETIEAPPHPFFSPLPSPFLRAPATRWSGAWPSGCVTMPRVPRQATRSRARGTKPQSPVPPPSLFLCLRPMPTICSMTSTTTISTASSRGAHTGEAHTMWLILGHRWFSVLSRLPPAFPYHMLHPRFASNCHSTPSPLLCFSPDSFALWPSLTRLALLTSQVCLDAPRVPHGGPHLRLHQGPVQGRTQRVGVLG